LKFPCDHFSRAYFATAIKFLWWWECGGGCERNFERKMRYARAIWHQMFVSFPFFSTTCHMPKKERRLLCIAYPTSLCSTCNQRHITIPSLLFRPPPYHLIYNPYQYSFLQTPHHPAGHFLAPAGLLMSVPPPKPPLLMLPAWLRLLTSFHTPWWWLILTQGTFLFLQNNLYGCSAIYDLVGHQILQELNIKCHHPQHCHAQLQGFWSVGLKL